MHIVIVGCGRVGSQLANMLSQEGHSVAVVDKDPTAFKRLSKNFQGEIVTGVGFDRQTLIKAGIEHADAFASVTNGDNTNIVSALLVKRTFNVPCVITRIYDPQRAEIYRRFGIPTISSTTWAANELKEMICYAGLPSRLTLGSGEVEIVEVAAPPKLAGHPIGELNVPGELSVVAVVHAGKALIPGPGASLEKGDLLYIAALNPAMEKLQKLLSGE
jgi:trk system potassium uptake protein TrkA